LENLLRSFERSGLAPDPLELAAQEALRRIELRRLPEPEPEEVESEDLTAEQEQERYAQKLKKNFHEFIKAAWHVLEGGREYIDNWHIEAVCIHLQEVYKGIGQFSGLKNLLINIPPGTSKSLMCNVFFPAWVWLTKPDWRAMFSSYAMDLSIRDSLKCRDLIQSDWYQETFKPDWQLDPNKKTQKFFKNTRGGFRLCVSISSGGTGHRADSLFVDDPLNAVDRHSENARKQVKDWFDTTLTNRLSDMQSGSKVVIMQRLHDDDLSGHILSKYGEDFTHLMIPMEYDERRHCRTHLWSDPRSEPGQIMDPRRFPPTIIAHLRKSLGSLDYNGQYQQTPAPADGVIYKRAHWRYWLPSDHAHLLSRTDLINYRDEKGNLITPHVEVLPYTLEEMYTRSDIWDEAAQSWDLTFDEGKGSVFNTGQVWARKAVKKFLLEQVRGRWGITRVLVEVINLTKLIPVATGKMIEAKANGPAVMNLLRSKISGFLPTLPTTNKIARSYAVQPSHEAGEWYIPHPALKPWVVEFVNNFSKAPVGLMDEIDTANQIVHRFNMHADREGTGENHNRHTYIWKT
jgi:predicted phage terminase large subunit-like protein